MLFDQLFEVGMMSIRGNPRRIVRVAWCATHYRLESKETHWNMLVCSKYGAREVLPIGGVHYSLLIRSSYGVHS